VVVATIDMDRHKMLCADLTPNDADLPVTTTGEFAPVPTGVVGPPVTGTATLTRNTSDSTLEMDLAGLDTEFDYEYRIATIPCEVNGDNFQYLIDQSIGELPENVISEVFSPMPDGTATPSFQADFRLREDAQAVFLSLVPDTEPPQSVLFSCASIVRDPAPISTARGSGSLLPAGMDRTPLMTSSATLTRNLDETTRVELSISDSSPDTLHPVHVHDRPCSIDTGGGHYKRDRSVAETLEENEIWIPVTTDESGAASAEILVEHLARPDAQALVIHDEADGERLACIDLD
jgi:hypothetical protein